MSRQGGVTVEQPVAVERKHYCRTALSGRNSYRKPAIYAQSSKLHKLVSNSASNTWIFCALIDFISLDFLTLRYLIMFLQIILILVLFETAQHFLRSQSIVLTNKTKVSRTRRFVHWNLCGYIAEYVGTVSCQWKEFVFSTHSKAEAKVVSYRQ